MDFPAAFPPLEMSTKYLRLVEIEIFSWCNRKCWFCPNSFIDRHSENILMSPYIYEKIIFDLKKINFSGVISYSRYNEPFSHLEIFEERIRFARKYLPKVILHTNTNGDFITRDALERVYNAGLRSLNIQYYLMENEIFEREVIKNRITSICAEKLLLSVRMLKEWSDYVEAELTFKDMKIRMRALDFKVFGVNRGGSLAKITGEKRITPCHIPFVDMYIDYNGSCMPCCNLRSDIPFHRKYIMGNIKDESLLGIYNGEKMKNFRYQVIQNPIIPSPCKKCNFSTGFKFSS